MTAWVIKRLKLIARVNGTHFTISTWTTNTFWLWFERGILFSFTKIWLTFSFQDCGGTIHNFRVALFVEATKMEDYGYIHGSYLLYLQKMTKKPTAVKTGQGFTNHIDKLVCNWQLLCHIYSFLFNMLILFKNTNKKVA